MTTPPAVVPLTVTVQCDSDSVQDGEENVTLPNPDALDHVMVPVWERAVPVTVAVQRTVVPAGKVNEPEHVTWVVVDALLTENEADPVPAWS